MRLRHLAALLISIVGYVSLAACGGGKGSSSGGGGITTGGNVPAPTVVTVSAGQTASGVDITVASPASNPTPNAESLGTGTSASNTGTTISQGSTATVILFGPGLSGNMTISISGPNDITISNAQTIMSTTNVPGIQFTAAVASNAALGARTVVLQDSNNDITTFSGGLEVVP